MEIPCFVSLFDLCSFRPSDAVESLFAIPNMLGDPNQLKEIDCETWQIVALIYILCVSVCTLICFISMEFQPHPCLCRQQGKHGLAATVGADLQTLLWPHLCEHFGVGRRVVLRHGQIGKDCNMICCDSVLELVFESVFQSLLV